MRFKSASANAGVSGKFSGIKRIFGVTAPINAPWGRGKPLFPALRVDKSLVLHIAKSVNSLDLVMALFVLRLLGLVGVGVGVGVGAGAEVGVGVISEDLEGGDADGNGDVD